MPNGSGKDRALCPSSKEPPEEPKESLKSAVGIRRDALVEACDVADDVGVGTALRTSCWDKLKEPPLRRTTPKAGRTTTTLAECGAATPAGAVKDAPRPAAATSGGAAAAEAEPTGGGGAARDRTNGRIMTGEELRVAACDLEVTASYAKPRVNNGDWLRVGDAQGWYDGCAWCTATGS